MENNKIIFTYTRTNLRDNNEDSCLAYSISINNDNTDKATVLLLSDGMGGMEHGEVMSNLSISNMANFINSQIIEKNIIPNSKEGENDLDFKKILLNGIQYTNGRIQKFISSNRWSKTGATLVSTIVRKNKFYYGYLGDSRLYHWSLKNKIITPVTIDHNVPGIMVKEGVITTEVARFHAQKNMLVYFMGVDLIPSNDKIEFIGEGDLEEGDYLFLCSDGVNSNFSDTILQEYFSEILNDETIEEADKMSSITKRIVEEAASQGERDNQTVVFYRHNTDKIEEEEDKNKEETAASMLEKDREVDVDLKMKPDLENISDTVLETIEEGTSEKSDAGILDKVINETEDGKLVNINQTISELNIGNSREILDETLDGEKEEKLNAEMNDVDINKTITEGVPVKKSLMNNIKDFFTGK